MRKPVSVELDTLYPLYLCVDQQGKITRLSAALEQEIGDGAHGELFWQAFRFSRPVLQGASDTPLRSYASHLLLFHTWDGSFSMRGQLGSFAEADAETILLITPWLTWLVERQPDRLLLPASFPVLDAQMELQVYLSSQRFMMSELQELLVKLRHANVLATSASDAKSEFIKHISHELRTPLSGILGALELLSQRGLDSESSTWVDLVRKSSMALLTVINQIIDYSKAASGDESLQLIEFDPVKLCRDVLDILEVEASRKKATLTLLPDPTSALTLRGDCVKVQNVLLRLVANAIKHGSPGAVQLSLSVTGANASADTVELYIEIRDQGPGVKPDDRERIFNDFQAVPVSASALVSGEAPSPAPGLGLAIARREISLLGGELGVHDNPEGRGSAFWIKVPLLRVESELVSHSDLAVDDPQLPASALLVVDDNPINIRLAQVQLERLGMTVDCAGAGAEAVEKCRLRRYDLVLMDIQMPGLSGVEATRQLRTLPDYADVPVIAWTANASESDVALFREVGINDILEKPANKAAITAKLRSWL